MMDPEKLKMFIERDLPGYEVAQEEDLPADFSTDFPLPEPTLSFKAWRDKQAYEPPKQNPFLDKFNIKKSPGK